MKRKSKHLTGVLLLVVAGVLLGNFHKVTAAPITITVNSVGDDNDTIPGNGTCETINPGECTLRAAVQEANSNTNPSDQDVIEFNISGTGVKTITLNSPLYISQNVLINGYSQPGSSVNTAAYPAALNGTLLIEINGANAQIATDSGADNTTIRGLIINDNNPGSIVVDPGSDNVKIEGNYIQTDSSGLIPTWGVNGGHAIVSSGSGTQVGGSDPSQRNVVSARGSYFVGIGNGGYTLKGNNFGVGSDSITPLPQDNTYTSSVAGVLITGANNVVGGAAAGDGNYIANEVFSVGGLLISNATDSVVKGNTITDNKTGIHIIGNTSNITIGGLTTAERNIISGNVDNVYGSGIYIESPSNDIKILGNYVGVDSDGVTPLPNSHVGIANFGDNVTIGGAVPGSQNVISGNTLKAVESRGSNTKIQGNYIGVGSDGVSAVPNGSEGVFILGNAATGIIGGSVPGEANIIANNGAQAVYIDAPAVSVLGNSIYNNGELGIDLSLPGVNVNDQNDSDSGPNDRLNYPVLLAPIESAGNTEIAYRLDVPAGDYRIEFFDNAAYDATGHGEGKTYIDSQNVTSSGAGAQLFSKTLTGVDHQHVSATATEINGDNSTGFGPTSEFSGLPDQDNDITVTKSIVDQNTIISDGTISYSVEYRNNGIDNINLNQFTADPGDPLNTALFNDIFPSNLNFVSVTGDASCAEQNSASTFGSLFADRTSDEVLSCAYNGGDPTLGPSESLIFTLKFSLSDPLENVFTNYLLVVPNQYDYASSATYDAAVDSGNDIITELGDNFDNLSQASTTANYETHVTKSVVDQETISLDGTIAYNVSFTNDGPDTINLNQFTADPGDPLNTALFNDIFPNNLTFVSAVGDVSCTEQNPSNTFGTLFENHTNHTVLSCAYSGADPALGSGDSLDVTLSFTLGDTSLNEFSNYLLSVPKLNDTSYTFYQNSVSSGNDILNYLSGNTDNLAVASTTKPITDLEISKVLDNPEDVAQNATLHYSINLKNNGPDLLNLQNTNTPFFSPALFYDYVHPDLIPLNLGNASMFPGSFDIDVGNSDLDCIWGGPGSGALLGLTTHSDYGLILCWYGGTDTALQSGDSLTAAIDFQVSSDSELSFTNYAFAESISSSDPDQVAINEAYSEAAANGLDGLAGLKTMQSPVNNFARAELPADIDLSLDFVNPEDILPGNTVYYDVHLKNNGTTGLDLSNYAALSRGLFAGVFPAQDLTLVGSNKNDINCVSVGPGSNVYLGAAAQDHSTYELYSCNYTGLTSQYIMPGDTFTTRIALTVNNGVSNKFSFYAVQTAVTGDPDTQQLGQDLFGASEDVLDTIENENFARLATVVPDRVPLAVAPSRTSLSSTGENHRKILILAGIIVLVGGTAFVIALLSRRRK